MIDDYSRNIRYLRLSVTDLCNLKCKYCMPVSGIAKKEHAQMLRNEDILKIVRATRDLGIDKVRLTGGEPLVRRGIIDIVKGISDMGGIKDLAMTTNGMLLPEWAKPLKDAGLNRVNISIDSLNPEKYAEITRGGSLASVLKGIEAAKEAGLLPIKMNVVVVNGFNTDEIQDFIGFASAGVEVRFIELMPIGEAADWNQSQFISNSHVFHQVKHLLDLDSESASGPTTHYSKLNGSGRIGFINPISDHFCSRCDRIRVTADGHLKTCLHSHNEMPLKPYLQDEELLKAMIQKAIVGKPLRHQLNDEAFKPIKRNMHSIGG